MIRFVVSSVILVVGILRYAFREEETESYLYVKGIQPEDRDELEEGWNRFKSQASYPLYCVFLAKQSDSEVVSLIEHYRPEFAQVSGQDCCFVYFRDLEKAKELAPYDYAEHDRWVYTLADLVGVEYRELPCLLFFEQMDSGEYQLVSLKGQSEQEIMTLVREMFAYMREHKSSKPLEALQGFRRTRKLLVTRNTLVENARQIGPSVVAAFLKSLVTAPFGSG